MKMKRLLILTAVTAALGLARSGSAQVVDLMNDTSYFGPAFGGETATANGDGTLTLTRTVANQDAGIDWGRQQTGGFLQIGSANLLTLTPVGPVNGGYYNVDILLFNSSGGYLAEKQWLGDNNSSAVQTLDVAQFVSNLVPSNPSLSAATEYWVRFRVDPYGQAGAGFTYTELSAVPEPTTGLFLLTGLPLLWLARRRTQAG
jgi:hypothetical protein